MTSISQAKKQIKEQRKKLAEQRKKIKESGSKVEKAKKELPDVKSQRYLRGQKGEKGISGRKFRREVKGTKEKLTGKEKELAKQKKRLKEFEAEKLVPFEKEVKKAEERQRQRELVNKILEAKADPDKGVPLRWGKELNEYGRKLLAEAHRKKEESALGARRMQKNILEDEYPDYDFKLEGGKFVGELKEGVKELDFSKKDFSIDTKRLDRDTKTDLKQFQSMMPLVSASGITGGAISQKTKKDGVISKVKSFVWDIFNKDKQLDKIKVGDKTFTTISAQPTRSTIQTDPFTGQKTTGTVLVKDYKKPTTKEIFVEPFTDLPRTILKTRDMGAKAVGKGVEKGLGKAGIDVIRSPRYYTEKVGEYIERPELLFERAKRGFTRKGKEARVEDGVLRLVSADKDRGYMDLEEKRRLGEENILTRKEIGKGAETGAKFGSYFLSHVGLVIGGSEVQQEVSKSGGATEFIKERPIESTIIGASALLGVGSVGRKLTKAPIIKTLDSKTTKLTTRGDEFFGKRIQVGRGGVKILPSERGVTISRKEVTPRTEKMDELFVLGKRPTKTKRTEDTSMDLFEDVKGYSVQTQEGSFPVVSWFEKRPFQKAVERKIEIKSPFTRKGKEAREFAMEKLTSRGLSEKGAKEILRVRQPRVTKSEFTGDILSIEKGGKRVVLARGTRKRTPFVEDIGGVKTRGGLGRGEFVRGVSTPLKKPKRFTDDLSLEKSLTKEQETFMTKKGGFFTKLDKKPKEDLTRRITLGKKIKDTELETTIIGDVKTTKVKRGDITKVDEEGLLFPEELFLKTKSKKDISFFPTQKIQRAEVYRDVSLAKTLGKKGKEPSRGTVLLTEAPEAQSLQISFGGKTQKVAGEQEASALLSLEKSLTPKTTKQPSPKLETKQENIIESLSTTKKPIITGKSISSQIKTEETKAKTSEGFISPVLSKQDVETKQTTRQKQDLGQISRTITKPLSATKTKGAMKIRERQEVDSKLRELSAIKTKSTAKTLLSSMIRPKATAKTKTRITTTKTTPPKKPKITIIPKPESPKEKIKTEAKEVLGTFKLFVRKGGEDIQIGKARTEEEAFKSLKGQLKSTLRASGFVEKGGKKVKPFKFIKGMEFRISKENPFRVVEKRGKRLRKGTTGKQIQFFKKNKGRKMNLFQ